MATVDQDRLLTKFKDLKSTTLKTNDPAVRKRAIQSLSDMIPSPYMPVNAAVIDFLEKMFRIYPDLQELIINASWNMIEEPKAEVWLAGIKFITALSRAAPDRWVRKNVDVFIQMFAFLDDQNDFNRVYEALGEHMAINTPVTLDVLCACLDSSKPIGTLDPAADPQAIRTRILDFLVLREEDIGRLNKLQIATYHRALLKALPSSTAQEMSIIVMSLFHEPLSDEFQGRLMQTLLQRAQSALSNPAIVDDAIATSEMAYDVYKRHGSHPRDRALLWGYYSSETSLKLRPTFSPANQVKMVDRLADVLDIDPSTLNQPLARDHAVHRNRAADNIDDWKRVILTSNDQLWKAATPLLKAVLQKCKDQPDWTPDETALQKLNDRLMSPNMRSTVRPLALLARAVLQDIDSTLKSRMAILKEQAVVPSPPIERPSSVLSKRKAEVLQMNDPPTTNPGITQAPYTSLAPPPLSKEHSRAIPRNGSALLARMNAASRSPPLPVPTAVAPVVASDPSQVDSRPSKRSRQSEDFIGKPGSARSSNLLSRISSGLSDTSRDLPPAHAIPPPEIRPNLAARMSATSNSVPQMSRLSPLISTPLPKPAPPAGNPPVQAVNSPKIPLPMPKSTTKPSLSILGIASIPTSNSIKAVQGPSKESSKPQSVPSPLPSPAVNTIAGPFSGLNIRGAASKSASVRGTLSFQKALQDLAPASAPSSGAQVKKARPAISVRRSSSSLLARFTDGDSNRPSQSSAPAPSLRDRMR